MQVINIHYKGRACPRCAIEISCECISLFIASQSNFHIITRDSDECFFTRAKKQKKRRAETVVPESPALRFSAIEFATGGDDEPIESR